MIRLLEKRDKMKSIVKFIKTDIELENIFMIDVDDYNLEVFIPSLSHAINYDIVYAVDIEAEVFDEYVVEESEETPMLRKIDDSLKYEIIGLLMDGSIKVNRWTFEDEFLKSDFGYLDGKIVKWKVDRLNLYFEE